MCEIASITRSVGGLREWSPDRTKYLVTQKDANGISQVYVGTAGVNKLACLTCTQRPGGPAPHLHKMQAHWHPSGKWIVLAVERLDHEIPWYATKELVEGWLQCGIWTNIWAVSANGERWHRLTDFGPWWQGKTADGFTGVAFTPDGKKAVWSELVDGNVFEYTFGRWELTIADWSEVSGVPQLVNQGNITPADMHWNEPGNFHPDGRTLLITGHVGRTNASGQDQYTLDIETGELTNLTNSGIAWDEHGVFSPNGEKIFFMSSAPFLAEHWAHNAVFLKTEFMLMNKDGSGLQQLTHFHTTGYPESNQPFKGGMAANGSWHPDGKSVSALKLLFPTYETWDITFKGGCG